MRRWRTLLIVTAALALAAGPTRRAWCAAAQAPADSSAGLTEEQERELERIGTLGYVVEGDRAPVSEGVTTAAPEAFAGYTIYVSRDYPGAFLIDMDGRVLHTWHEAIAREWTRVWVYPDGSILAVTAYPGALLKLGQDSNVIWSYGNSRLRAHHDVVVAPDGRIYVLMRRGRIFDWLDGRAFLDDMVCILDPSGDTVKEETCLSIADAFKGSDYAWLLTSPEFGQGSDPLHTNSVEVLDGRIPGPEFRAGNILLSLRGPDCLVVLDPDLGKIVWMSRGPWQKQHEARETPDGHLLLFDNRKFEGHSRVVEYDPVNDKILWTYTAEGFFSVGTGAEQLLPNGDLLITESQKGRIIEVKRDGTVVWEFLNPRRLKNGSVIVRLTRAFRVPYDYFTGPFAETLERARRSR
jgi:hypothetical protein